MQLDVPCFADTQRRPVLSQIEMKGEGAGEEGGGKGGKRLGGEDGEGCGLDVK